MGNLAIEESSESAVPIEVAAVPLLKTETVPPVLTQYHVAGFVINAVSFAEFREQLALHFEDYFPAGRHEMEIGYETEYFRGMVRFMVNNPPAEKTGENIDERQ